MKVDKKDLLYNDTFNNTKNSSKIDKTFKSYNDYLITCKPIRTYAPSYTQYYDKPQKNIKRCKICIDKWDNAKLLTNMAHAHKTMKETSTYYYLDIERGIVDKLKVYLHHHKNAKLNNDNVYFGTKTQAQKKLEKLMA